jgi:hypothetical protein
MNQPARLLALLLVLLFITSTLPAHAQAKPQNRVSKFTEDFETFLGTRITPNPEDGDLDAQYWSVSGANFGGVLDLDQVSRLAPGQAGTIFAWHDDRHKAMAIRSGTSPATVSLHIPFSDDAGSNFRVEFKAYLIQDAKVAPESRIEFAWSAGKGFTPVATASATLRSSRPEVSPRFTIDASPGPVSAAKTLDDARSKGSPAPPRVPTDLTLQWTVPASSGIVVLDEISIQPVFMTDKLVVWVSVDAQDNERSLLRELVRARLKQVGLDSVPCEADLDTEIQLKTLLGQNGQKRQSDNPTRADLLTALTNTGCKLPTHAELYVAYVAARTDSRGTRTAVLRLTPLDDRLDSYAGSISEPTETQWTWTDIVDRLTHKALHRPPPPERGPSKAVAEKILLPLFLAADDTARLRWFELFHCDDEASCRELVEDFHRHSLCLWENPGPDKECPFTAPTPSWSGLQGFPAGRTRTIRPSNAATLYDRTLLIHQPGDYVLVHSDDFDERLLDHWLHVEPYRNLVRLSAGAHTGPLRFASTFGYYRLLSNALDMNFWLGLDGVTGSSDDRMAGLLSALASYSFALIPFYVSVDGALYAGPSINVERSAPVFPTAGASVSTEVSSFPRGGEGYLDRADSEIMLSVGPRLTLLKVLDGSDHWDPILTLQGSADF